MGLSGLEQLYDDALSGTPGRVVSNAASMVAPSLRVSVKRNPPLMVRTFTSPSTARCNSRRAGTRAARKRLGGLGGTVIIAEPATGDILAMASVKTTDNGRVVTTSENRALTWTYEPASVMKAMTFAAVLNEGVSTPSTPRVVQDEIQLYEETFTDDVAYGSKVMTTTDIVVGSSNTGTISWAQDLGSEKLYDYMLRFGFGASSIDFPGESPGILDHVDDWSGTHIATVAIGQGIAVTPIQMLSAYNVIANDGLYVAPRLVSAVGTEAGEASTAEAVRKRRYTQGRQH